MSSKSHIFLDDVLEIYEETNESIYSFGKFMGFNIYFSVDTAYLHLSKIHGHFIEIQTINEESPSFKMILIDIESIIFSRYALSLVIKGGSSTAEKIKKMDFTSLTFSNVK